MKWYGLVAFISLLYTSAFTQNVGIDILNPVFKLDVRNGSINVDSLYRISTIQVLSVAGSGNLFVGKNAGRMNTGILNTFSGDYAGFNNTAGSFNSFFGQSAGYTNTTGNDNSFFGRECGVSNTTGSSNSFYGVWSGHNNTTGTKNAFFGSFSGYGITT